MRCASNICPCDGGKLTCAAVQALEAADLSDDALDAELKKAETEALEARAAYVLRTKLIQHVLLTDPVLKSVHTGANGNALEQYDFHMPSDSMTADLPT